MRAVVWMVMKVNTSCGGKTSTLAVLTEQDPRIMTVNTSRAFKNLFFMWLCTFEGTKPSF